jgi:hypothetical protein
VDEKGYFNTFMKNQRNYLYSPFSFFKPLPPTQSPGAQLSNKLKLSPNHWAKPLKFRKNSFNQQKIFIQKNSHLTSQDT